MNIKSISYTQSKESYYSNGLKRWDKAGIEIELEPKDSIDNAFDLAKQIVSEQLKQTGFQDESVTLKGSTVLDESKITQRDLLIKDMDEASDIKTLMVIYNEAESALQTDAKFTDAVLRNKKRLEK